METIYFDNAATTRAYDSVQEIIARVLTTDYGNPSSMHLAGIEAEAYVRDAKEAIAKALHVKEKEIFFTSGGTEANNWAIFGAAEALRRRGNRVIVSAMEHPSVAEAMKELAGRGFEVLVVGDMGGIRRIGEEGTMSDERIDPTQAGYAETLYAQLEDALNEETILVSIMLVNNETGFMTDPAKIAKLIKEKAPHAVYHADAIQAFGKIPLMPKSAGIDLLTVSGHKIHGPKGIGFLYKNETVRIRPLLFGGGQQDGMRSGTDNVPGIAGIGEAVRQMGGAEELQTRASHMQTLRDALRAELRALNAELEEREGGAGPFVVVHDGRTEESFAPHIVNVAFPGVGAEVLLHALEEHGIYISAGSACSSHKKQISPTLQAMGIAKEEMESSVRFSFSEWNTIEEIKKTTEVLRTVLPVLRRYRAK